jgi:hypothetical protein
LKPTPGGRHKSFCIKLTLTQLDLYCDKRLFEGRREQNDVLVYVHEGKQRTLYIQKIDSLIGRKISALYPC